MKYFDLQGIFNTVIKAVFSLILFFLIISIIFGVLRLFLLLGDLVVTKELAQGYLRIISDVLTLFILIELSRSLADYFNIYRLRMTYIVDAAIVFVLREVMIRLFEHTMEPSELYALSALLFVLTVLRIGSVFVYQREKKMLANTGEMIGKSGA